MFRKSKKNKKQFDIRVYEVVCLQPHIKYRYKICENIPFSVNGFAYFIPKNFTTDLASIPRLFWPIISPFYSTLIAPSIIHDWMYCKDSLFNRKKADLIFYQMLSDNGINKIFAYIMYLNVRWFGWIFYRRR